MNGYLVCMRRSDFQVNAYTTHGVFGSEADAKWYAEDTLGWKPDTYDILTIKMAGTK